MLPLAGACGRPGPSSGATQRCLPCRSSLSASRCLPRICEGAGVAALAVVALGGLMLAVDRLDSQSGQSLQALAGSGTELSFTADGAPYAIGP